MKGICIDPGETTTLTEGTEYFLFEHGPNNFYVSRFDNKKAHFGSYQRSYFKVIDKSNETEIPQESKIQRFVAVVNRPRNGYRVGDKFIIGPSKYEPYFNVFLYDYPERGPIGSYIQNFFEILEPYIEPEKPKFEIKQASDINTSDKEEKPNMSQSDKPKCRITQIYIKRTKKQSGPKKKLNKYEQLEEVGQLSLFEI